MKHKFMYKHKKKSMKLATRLKISFLIMAVFPIMLFAVIMTGLLKYNYRSIDKYYGITGTDIDSIINPVKFYNEVSDKVYNDFSIILDTEPELMTDEVYLANLSDRLAKKSTGFVVEVDGEKYFVSPSVDYDAIADGLHKYDKVGDIGSTSMYYGDEFRCVFRYMSREVEGSVIDVYIFTYVDSLMMHVKSVMWQCAIAIIAVIVLTSGYLIRKIYSATITPLTKLRKAANDIREGNLDFELEVEGDDVISGLFEDFEAMRKRLKESAEEKLQYDRESKELISNISHDLKTPITAIKGYVEGLVDGVAVTPQMQDRYLKTIYKKAIEMDRLIDELTLYSKIDTNRIPYKFEKVSFKGFFDDCADSLKVELEAKGIDFVYRDYTAGDITIIADVEQLSRIVNNIVSNSIKYMNNDCGRIMMTLKDEGDFVRVEMADNGQGISKADLPHIFDRFYRSDASRNSATGGSGIGLAIVKKIVEDHGGRIWAESKEGQGTTMCFVIRKYMEA